MSNINPILRCLSWCEWGHRWSLGEGWVCG